MADRSAKVEYKTRWRIHWYTGYVFCGQSTERVVFGDDGKTIVKREKLNG